MHMSAVSKSHRYWILGPNNASNNLFSHSPHLREHNFTMMAQAWAIIPEMSQTCPCPQQKLGIVPIQTRHKYKPIFDKKLTHSTMLHDPARRRELIFIGF